MSRDKLLALLEIEAAMPGPLPGIPYDSPADQKARREALAADLRTFDRYRLYYRQPENIGEAA